MSCTKHQSSVVSYHARTSMQAHSYIVLVMFPFVEKICAVQLKHPCNCRGVPLHLYALRFADTEDYIKPVDGNVWLEAMMNESVHTTILP